MMNVSPEELRRLQILNDYVAQSLEAAQRLNPYLQTRGVWHTGYGPGVIPQVPVTAGINALPFTGGLRATPYGVPTGGLFHTPFVPGAFNPFTEGAYASVYGVNPAYGALSPLMRGGYVGQGIGAFGYGNGLQHTGYETGYGPYGYGAISPMARGPWGVPGISPITPMGYMGGLNHTGYESPVANVTNTFGLDPYTAAATQAAMHYQAQLEAQRRAYIQMQMPGYGAGYGYGI